MSFWVGGRKEIDDTKENVGGKGKDKLIFFCLFYTIGTEERTSPVGVPFLNLATRKETIGTGATAGCRGDKVVASRIC